MKTTSFVIALTFVLAAALVTACTSLRLPGVHRIDIQQGNILTQESVRQLSTGMDKRQVRSLLGTPLVVNPFDSNQWHYLYTLEEGSGKETERMLSVYFDNERLVRVAGDIRAIEEDKEIVAGSQRVVTVPDQRRDRGVFGWVASILGIDESDAPVRDDEPMPEIRGAAAIEDPNSRLPPPR